MLESGEFKKLDLGSDLLNFRKYGTSTVPHYDLKKINNFKISLICGKTDLLSSPGDYNWLNEELIEYGNQMNFQEYECGHIGLILPKETRINDNIFDQIVNSY
jgi:hypothetical protein